jgi:hypothetical protein
MSSFASQWQNSVHHQRLVVHFRKRWTGPTIDIVWEYHLLSSSYELRDCSWAWACAKVRLIETNFIACFLYCLPISFTYLTKDNLSKAVDLAGTLVEVGWVACIE